MSNAPLRSPSQTEEEVLSERGPSSQRRDALEPTLGTEYHLAVTSALATPLTPRKYFRDILAAALTGLIFYFV